MFLRIIHISISYFLSPTFWLSLLMLTIFWGITFHSKRYGLRIWGISKGVFTVLLMRFLLFGTPFSWMLYGHLLSAEDIGFRQKGVIRNEWKTYELKLNSTACAIGSSQTGAVFLEAEKSGEVSVFSLSGMGPVDLFYYRNYIREISPKTIILTLSEFDLAHQPNFAGIKLLPSQGPGVISSLQHLRGSVDSNFEIVLAELFPEYKYSFVFKGFVNKLSHTHSRHVIGKEEGDKVLLNNLKYGLKEKYISCNIHFLRAFLNSVPNVKIIILEGQYLPSVQSLSYNESLRSYSVSQIKSLTQEFHNISYYPISELYQFSEEDYIDPYHVSPEAGAKYTQHFFTLLRK